MSEFFENEQRLKATEQAVGDISVAIGLKVEQPVDFSTSPPKKGVRFSHSAVLNDIHERLEQLEANGLGTTTTRNERQHMHEEIKKLRQENADLRKQKDRAYEERNRVVAAMARSVQANGQTVWRTNTNIEGWDPERRNVIMVQTENCGQFSWHYHDDHAYLFRDFPYYDPENVPFKYDGHTTEGKYGRLEQCRPSLSEPRILDRVREMFGILVHHDNGKMDDEETLNRIKSLVSAAINDEG